MVEGLTGKTGFLIRGQKNGDREQLGCAGPDRNGKVGGAAVLRSGRVAPEPLDCHTGARKWDRGLWRFGRGIRVR